MQWCGLIVTFLVVVLPGVYSTHSEAMTVLAVWNTFHSQMNMRCICKHAVKVITPKFYVNISLSSPAFISGAWIAKILQSSTTNIWHLLENKYYSYPPTIDLWFDLRYETNDPQPTGVCSWFFTDPTKPISTADNDFDSEKSTLKLITPVSTSPTAPVNESSVDDRVQDEPTTTQTSTPEVEVTRPADIIASCLCPCSCAKKSQEEIDAMIQEIIRDLAIDMNNTALARRKLSSASDTRWVSRGIGFVGVLVMTFVFGSIALSDYKRFLNGFRLLIENLKRLR